MAKESQKCSFFFTHFDFDRLPFFQREGGFDIVKNQFPGSPQDPDFHNGILPENKVVHKFRTVAESQSHPHPEGSVGDASVIGGASVDSGNSHTVTHDFFGINFTINHDFIA